MIFELLESHVKAGERGIGTGAFMANDTEVDSCSYHEHNNGERKCSHRARERT